jgi:hypothetical protein
MSTIKDYSIIETEWIENRLNTYQRFLMNEQDSDKIDVYQALVNELKEIKSKLKPLTPIVENAYDAGYDYGFDSANMDEGYSLNYPNKEDYINKTIIE